MCFLLTIAPRYFLKQKLFKLKKSLNQISNSANNAVLCFKKNVSFGVRKEKLVCKASHCSLC